MKFPASFRTSLTLHFVAVATLPLLMLGVFGQQYFTTKHLETVSGLIDTHALVVSREAIQFLEDIGANLQMVEATLRSGLLRSEADINEYLQLAVRSSANFESIYLLDSSHRITHLGQLEIDGEASSDYIGLDLSGHEIFKGGGRLAGPVWSNTFLSTITVEPSIILALPLGDGALLGTVSLQKLSTGLMARLEHTRASFQFSLLDRHGVLIADSRPGQTAQRLNMRQHPEIRNALDKQVEIPSKYHEDNSLLESVRLVHGTGWVAYASLPVQEALRELEPLRYLMFSALTFAACLASVFAIWLSRRLLQPVLLLRDAAGEVASGNYAQILQPAAYYELEELSASFREMITAVGERELAISENRARYRDLVNSIDGIVWELELADFRFTFVSRQAEKILGYPAQRWLDEQDFWASHVHEEDRDWVVAYCMAETQGRRDHNFEYRMVAADGRVIWLKDIVSVVCEDDLPVRLRGVMLDITMRKEAELHLRETTEQLQLLINRMPFGCIMWDADHRVELWNPAAEQIFGFSADQVAGLQPHEFLLPEHRKAALGTFLEQHGMTVAKATSINESLTRDGQIITCEWQNTQLLGPEGLPQGVISIVQDITQRAAAETALKESEVRFRTVFQTNPDAVLITRLSDGTILDVNENCLTLSGYARDEIIGQTAVELGMWFSIEERKAYLDLLRRHGSVENFEMLLRTRAGRIRTGLASARRLVLNDEECVLVVIRDITALKEAEARLVRSESRFRSLVSAMGEGVIILGFNGEIVQCNQAAERILKMPAEAMIGKLNVELAPDAIREDGTLYELDQHPSVITLKTGEAVDNRVMGVTRPDGSTVWLQINTHPLGLGRNGKPVAVVVSFADVTRLKRIEDDLRENQKNLLVLSQQFKGVLEAIPDQIMVIDRDMSMVWLNRQMHRGLAGQVELAGIPCFAMPDVPCGAASGNDAPLCDRCPVKRSFASGGAEEAQMRLADGRTLALRAFPVCNDQGQVINVIQTVQDISEAVRQQAQTMRTGQLAALGELAAGVAHEINNPINGVINYAQLILNKAAADSREQELAQRIIRESERVATIVRELLFFAREESFETNRLAVRDALDEALALTRSQLNKEGVDLQIRLPEDLPHVLSRSHQVQQLFLNLISNARHALAEKYPDPDPDKLLLITGEEFSRGGQPFVRIVVRDHGVGIDEQLLPKVMNPFITTKPSSEGTGLGLSISHEIVQKHGGSLSISSVRGKYTEVVVELPSAG